MADPRVRSTIRPPYSELGMVDVLVGVVAHRREVSEGSDLGVSRVFRA